MIENIVRKGQNAGCQHFPLFPQYFQKGLLKLRIIAMGECNTILSAYTCIDA